MPFNREYEETKRIMRGEARMPPEREDFARWIEANYGTKVLNVHHYPKDSGAGNRVRIVVPRISDEEELNAELAKDGSRAAVAKFLEAVENRRAVGYELGNLSVYATDILYWSWLDLWFKVDDDDVKEIRRRTHSPPLWTVAKRNLCFMFLFFTDEQARRHDTVEVRERYAAACFNVVRKHDELGFLEPRDVNLGFASKELVDRDYEGDLRTYVSARE